MLTGALLVLATWAIAWLVLVSLGLLPALACARRARGMETVRQAAWWGLLVVTVFAYLANLGWPLGSGSTAIALLLLVLLLGVPGWILLRSPRQRSGARRRPSGPGIAALWWIVVAALALAQAYLALAALGPVTNYDTGLYHLGAISYGREFAAIPGLANLYFPFGYANAEFPLAALLGNGPWSAEGYRLLNGLVMALAAIDLVIRLRLRLRTPGTWILLVGLVAAWVPLLGLADYWVTSPTQDSAVFVITLVATAALADAVLGRISWVADAGLALALGILLVLLRPTMAVFALAMLAVVIVLGVRRARPRAVLWRGGAVIVGLALVAGVAAVLRDARLSGWVLYPLSVLPLDVPWRAADPTQERLATLGYHRNPDDLWASTSGWDWVGPWLARLPAQWEAYELLGLTLVALGLLLMAGRLPAGVSRRWRAMGLAAAPSLVAALAWWLWTPPAFRFGWGPLVALIAVPAGWALWLLIWRGTTSRAGPRAGWVALAVAGLAIPIALVAAVSALGRFDAGALTETRSWAIGGSSGLSLPYAVAPVAEAPVAPQELPSGLVVMSPVDSDQCWAVWPMCTPQPSEGLRPRGAAIADGFLP